MIAVELEGGSRSPAWIELRDADGAALSERPIFAAIGGPESRIALALGATGDDGRLDVSNAIPGRLRLFTFESPGHFERGGVVRRDADDAAWVDLGSHDLSIQRKTAIVAR